MKWIILPVGKFIEAKRLVSQAFDAVVELYSGTLPEDPDAVLARAQGVWSKFLELAVEPGGVDPSLALVSEMTPDQIKDAAHDFFVHQAGKAQKSTA